MLKVIQDLKAYDVCKQEVEIVDSMYKVEFVKNTIKDSIITELRQNNKDYQSNLADCKAINTSYETVVKKQQEVITNLEWTVLGWKIATGVVAIIGLLPWVL